MPRGQSKTAKKNSSNAEEENISASQGSNTSDDHVLELAVAEKLLASKEKKRRDQQKQFIAAAHLQVHKELQVTSANLKDAVESIEEIYQAFIINYAAEEDKIRAIWSEIKEEKFKQQKLFEKILATSSTVSKQCEEAQIKALGAAKVAVLETQKVVDLISLKPT